MEKGGIKDLFFNNKKPMFKVNMQVQFDKDGNLQAFDKGRVIILWMNGIRKYRRNLTDENIRIIIDSFYCARL